jgi:MFS family permease
MADVVLGPVGSRVDVDLGTCAKSGRPTAYRVEFRGSTAPGWVTVLLLVSIVGYLFADAMTSRRYRVTLPFSRELHDRWQRGRRVAWLVAAVGVAFVVATLVVGGGTGFALLLVGVGLMAVAMLGGVVNAVRHGIGFRLTRDQELVVTGAHPAFAREVEAATVAPLPA